MVEVAAEGRSRAGPRLSTAERLIKIDESITTVQHEPMAMGKRAGGQDTMFVAHTQMPRSAGHPFYAALEQELKTAEFDKFVEDECRRFYHRKLGRPGLAPGVYFRCLLVGYFEGIDSERGIAWRAADSLSLREFLGLPLGTEPPDHSTISRTRRLIDVETHGAVFTWVLEVLARRGLVKGKTVGVDATTLEANAALRSIVRREDGQTYQEYLTELANASGIKTPTREDLARIDRKRKKKGSNDDWKNPHDPDAQITKTKDGKTHLAHKQEHAVDMATGAVLAVTIQGGAVGDTTSIEATLQHTFDNLRKVRKKVRIAASVTEAVADRGYHSNDTLLTLEAERIRSYIAEPDRGRRDWEDRSHAKRAVYRNRRRKAGRHGRSLMKRRGELIERSFAHTLNTGGMRRVHLRRHRNILKRVLVHVAAFNLGLLMRSLIGLGTPRGFQAARTALVACLAAVLVALRRVAQAIGTGESSLWPQIRFRRPPAPILV